MAAKILLLGEAWGEGEEIWHHPFVRYTGAELARIGSESGLFKPLMLSCKSCKKLSEFGHCEKCGFYNKATESQMVEFWQRTQDVSNIYCANVFNERPPGNDELFFFGGKADDIDASFPPYSIGPRKFYLLSKHKHHLDALSETIQRLRPNIIIALGNVPSWSIIGVTKISTIRGTVQWSEKFNCKVLPTFHPSYILHNISDRPIVVADLKKAEYESHFPEIRRPERWIIIDPTFDEIEEFFNIPAEYYAVDIESGFSLYSKAELGQMAKWQKRTGRNIRSPLASQIAMVGFARSESHALVIPLMNRDKESLNVYDNPQDECRAWEWIDYGLNLPQPKVFQHGLYDINRLLHYGLRPKNCLHDTMLLHHAMYAEMLKSLGFLASLYLNDVNWKSWYGSEGLKRDE